ncbi:MAG TPA: glycoside hydrolase N-terminal domain-containing protein [Vicinamibacteria bacterium]|nr:glycoside hydrolase N-terminal domain-containing protein [Vicinamibacteria bacterium]
MRLRFSILVVSVAFAITPGTPAFSAEPGIRVPARGFVSSRPATSWEHGLLSGNGTVGAVVMSDPLDETVIFSHERMFLPERPPMLPPHTGPRLFEIRRLIERRLYQQASQLAFDLSGQESFRYPDPFVPAFELGLRMDAGPHVTDYLRSVDFETGEASVQWADTRGLFVRKLFVSRADGVAAMLVTGPGPGSVSGRLELRSREPGHERFRKHVREAKSAAAGEFLTYRHRFTNAYPGSVHALEGVALVKPKGGSSRAEGSSIVITGADELLVIVDVSVIYEEEASSIDGTKARLSGVSGDYGRLLDRHARIHGGLFKRMRLDLGGGADHHLTSEELIAASTDEKPSRALIEKTFDAGRYNIISSTGELPPTLQGVWAGTWDPPWASDYTHNGNVPSAIASLLTGNTPELMLAYTSYIESIVPYLELNAQRIFGARGVVLPSRSTTNGFNNALAPRFAGAFWVAGAAWAAHFFYDYYLHTGDRAFLADHALPFMEKAALFFEDYLFEGKDGRYVFSPTQSPENAPANTKSQATYNATMDVAAAKELLTSLIAASRELGVNQGKIPVWERMLEKMPPYVFGPEGEVKEWLAPELEDNHAHRHTSQLYALYDGLPREIAQSPALQAAFKRVIELKLERHWKDWQRTRGYMSFGLVQLGQAATSLGDRELAYRSFLPLVNRYWLGNLASTHDYRSLFNMDVSGGLPAVLIRMLVASEPGTVHLLPAAPDAWPEGAIEGVLCRGQVEVERLEWRKSALEVILVSPRAQQIVVRAPSAIKTATLRSGKATLRAGSAPDRRLLSLPPGQAVTLALELE